MIATYVQRGDAIDYIPEAAVSAGDVVVLGDLIGIAKLDIPAGRLGALALTGVYRVAKAADAGVTFARGGKVYWDAGNKLAVAVAGSHKLLGLAVAASADADTSVQVVLVMADPVLAIPASEAVEDAAAATADDPAAMTAPAAGAGSGADATTYSGAQCDALRADVAELHLQLTAALADAADARTQLNALLASLRAGGYLAE